MGIDRVRLRPHHLLCGFLLPSELTNRGPVFASALAGLREELAPGSGTVVEVSRGVDDLCRSCPDCGDGRCESAFGDEGRVLKWDSRILEGLGLAYGASLTTDELGRIVTEKAPLAFCRERCPWASVCGVFKKG